MKSSYFYISQNPFIISAKATFTYPTVCSIWDKGYRYGFNGMEHDKDIGSDDYDFGARIYDGRIGRWLSLDPMMDEFPDISPYVGIGNNPIYFIDPNGLKPKPSKKPVVLLDIQEISNTAFLKSPTAKSLFTQLNPVKNGWKFHARSDGGYSVTYTSTKIISIKVNQSMNNAIIDFAWELTHANNHSKISTLDNSVIDNPESISKEEYINQTLGFEAEAQFNALLTADELGQLDKRFSKNPMYADFIKYKNAKDADKEKLKSETLKNHVENVKNDPNFKIKDGSGKAKTATEVYGENYDKLKAKGEEKRKKEEKKNETDTTATN